MLIAMQTRNSEVADYILAAVHLCFLVFYCGHGRTIFGERPTAIATLVALLRDVFLQYPTAIFSVHRLDMGINRYRTNRYRSNG